jgi:hypothetical protein
VVVAGINGGIVIGHFDKTSRAFTFMKPALALFLACGRGQCYPRTQHPFCICLERMWCFGEVATAWEGACWFLGCAVVEGIGEGMAVKI